MTTPSPCGRTRDGRSPLPMAATIGAIGAGVLALLTAWLNDGDAALAAMMGAATLPPCVLVGWIAVVDRTSIAGAVTNPQQSIESTWYDRAVRGAFHDMLAVIGLVLVALSIIPAWRHASASLILTLILVAVTIDVAVRYQLAARREG